MIQQQRRFTERTSSEAARTTESRFVGGRAEHDDESMGQAIARVAEAGQHLVLDRLDLLKVEARAALDERVAAATEAGKSLGLFAVGALFLRAGWVTLMVALGFYLAPRLGVAGALAIIGGVHVILALVILGVAASKRSAAARAVRGQLRARSEPVGART